MPDQVWEWLIIHWVEVTGTTFGLAYIVFSIKQHLLTWPIGLITSVLYIYVFFVSKFYADMALQFYYVWVSIYGWILWHRGKGNQADENPLLISRLTTKMTVILAIVSLVLILGIYFILKFYTDSPIPLGDAITTALSIVATWMLARKVLEHWILWVFVDALSLAMYAYKGLYSTTILFGVYVVSAVIGFYEWRKSYQQSQAEIVV